MSGFAERTKAFVPLGFDRRRLPGERTLLLHRRSWVVGLLLAILALTIALVSITTGSYEISATQALDALTGGGSATDRFIVRDQRLPRALAALLVGAALGASGTIFQTLSRNPLGSPDIVGFTTGSATGGLVAILVAGSPSGNSITIATILGGLLTTTLVVLFTLRRGLTGDRLILSGIALGAMLAAINDYLLSRAPIEAAETAKAWQYGSLNAISWPPLVPLTLALAVLLPIALTMNRSLRTLELGDDLATAMGLPTQRVRLWAIIIGIALCGIAVATAGPIGFLALAAPHLARSLTHSPGISIATAAVMGSTILVTADLLASRLLSPFQIPVGLVTSAIGGGYLLWLLIRQSRLAS